MVEGKSSGRGPGKEGTKAEADSGMASDASTPDLPTPPPVSALSNGQPNGATAELPPDTPLTLRIVSPGSEPFDMQVSSGELVQEIHQVLLDREETCQRTCFALYLGSALLDNFSEIRNVPGIKDRAELRVQEEPYTVREARVHLRHLRDLMRALDSSDALNGLECASLSFLGPLTALPLHHPSRPSVPDFVLPGTKERPLAPLHPPFGLSEAETEGGAGPKEGGGGGGKGDTEAEAKDAVGGCLRKLGLTGWNPPTGNRKLHGDLLYLYAETLEEKRFNITCCTRGFFVNQSSGERLDPRAAQPRQVHHSLVELLAHLSPAFKREFAAVQKRRCSRHIFERLPTPYQVYTWAAPAAEAPSWDPIRAEDASQSHRLGFEDHIPGQVRDWNEELQTTRELPRASQPERLVRERATFKIHSDFVSAAVKGAQAVVDGNVMAINPGDEPKMHMFIWNNIFFSLGFDVKEHYADLGGDAAAFVAPTNDLQGVRAYFNLDQEKLYTLGTVIVDYRGLRVTAQSIIPGILEREQEQSVVYGSIDFGKTVVTSDQYKDLMAKPAAALKIAPHTLKSQDGAEAQLYSSAETKGIIGNDGRAYILDLLRTFPPDINFLPGSDVTDVCRANGFPRAFPHKLASLRQELVDAFVEARYLMFIKIAAFNLQKMRYLKAEKEEGKDKKPAGDKTPVISIEAAKKSNGEQANGSKKTEVHNSQLAGCSTDAGPRSTGSLGLVEGEVVNGASGLGPDAGAGEAIAAEVKRKIVASSGGAEASRSRSPTPETDKAEEEAARRLLDEEKAEEAGTAEIIAKAARCVSSLSEQEFSIRFNPDAFCPTVVHAEDEADLGKQRKLIKEAAHFLLVTQIPNLVRDCLDHSLTPVDGAGLSEAMHSRGINIRYLGKVTSYIADIPQLSYLSVLCQTELVVRSAKHVWRGWVQGVESGSTASAVAHWLNCLVGSVPDPSPPENAFNASQLHLVRKGVTKSARRKTKAASKDQETKESAPWQALTPRGLWEAVAAEAESYYGYTLEADGVDAFLARSAVQRVSLLRRFLMTVGIQIQLRNYALDSPNKAPFGDEDILNLFPVVKHLNPRATDAWGLYQSGQSKISNGQLREGYALVTEALSLLNNVYGAMHPEIAQCLRLLARLAYILGDHQEALAQQHKAVLMSERCSGLDHPHTILEYMHLALYAFANLQIPTALRLLYRSRYLLLLAHGEEHPQMALVDANLGLILHACQEYDAALKFLQHANALHVHYYGPSSLKTALSHHLIASSHSCRGDFRAALAAEKEAFAIYRSVLGEAHEKTLESSDCLRQLTAQAVSFQKKMNEIAKAPAAALARDSIAALLPFAQPSLQLVLEMLNLVNGIVFVQISPGQLQAWRAQAAADAAAADVPALAKGAEAKALEDAPKDSPAKPAPDIALD